MAKITLRKQLLSKLDKQINKKEDELYFISSGCYLLNLALTGNIWKGYPRGRYICFKGGYGTGKTLLLIEALCSAIYIDKIKKGLKVKGRYNDAESALDTDFSKDLQLPDEIELTESETVQDFHEDLDTFLNNNKDYDLLLYGTDSLDALLAKEEQDEIKKGLSKIRKLRLKKEKEEDKPEGEEKEEKETGSYGAQKAKYMSKFFRDIRVKLRKSNCILFIVSQLRDDLQKKYGYGDKTYVSGGKAAPFYATQRIDVKKIEILKKTKDSEVSYGMKARLFIEKNKVYCSGRSCEIDIITSPAHGIDNYSSIIDFLVKNKEIDYKMARYNYSNILVKKSIDKKRDIWPTKEQLIEYLQKNPKEWEKMLNLTQEVWNQIEANCSVSRDEKWSGMIYK